MATTLLLGSAALLARDAPILHEYFDSQSGFVGESGEVAPRPVAVDASPSSTAPETSGAISSYSATRSSMGDAYSLDSDTSRPDVVGYDDPFSPSIPPFKRLFAYDAVNENFELVVSDPSLRPVAMGAPVSDGDDQFFADIPVQLGSHHAVRIPSVGPQVRIVAARLEPPAPFNIHRDSADNWFISSDATGPHRLRMHLTVDRRVFGSVVPDRSWRDLKPYLPALPAAVSRVAGRVLRRLNLSQRMRPAAALRELVAYFRAFRPSRERPSRAGVAQGGAAATLFEELTLEQEGVCRHRSFGFVPTALTLGIPARFIRNEAHAWVEVFDGDLWHRIDLGGAAGEMRLAAAPEVRHTAPPDPYSWPAAAGQGSDMARTAVAPSSGGAEHAESDATAADSSPSASGPAALASPDPDAASSAAALLQALPPAELQPPTVELRLFGDQVLRGRGVRVAGEVLQAGKPCGLTPVVVALARGAGWRKPVGTLVTDAHGHFSGTVTIPSDVEVGDYELLADARSGASCDERQRL
jgi:hypothetical protein